MAYNTKLQPLSEEQQRFLQNNALIIQTLVESHTEDTPDGVHPWAHPARLDATYAAWYAEHNRLEEDPDMMLTAFGVAFGEFLAAAFHLQWKFAEDRKGSSLVLAGMPGKLLLFPDLLMRKHYARGELGFFAALADRYARLLANLDGKHPPQVTAVEPWEKG